LAYTYGGKHSVQEDFYKICKEDKENRFLARFSNECIKTFKFIKDLEVYRNVHSIEVTLGVITDLIEEKK